MSAALGACSAPPFTVAVEGNIGSGKSTLLRYFEAVPDIHLCPEPIQQWCDMKGHNLLESLYRDPKRWSFQFQSYVQLTRLQLFRQKTRAQVRLLERSLQNNRYCFLQLAQKTGSLSKEELAVLHAWHDWLDQSMNLHLDLIVYLRSQPEVAHERMRSRNRAEESAAPLEYLTSLHEAYEEWLIERKFGDSPTPILVLDANQGLSAIQKQYQHITPIIRGQKILSRTIHYYPECLSADEDPGFNLSESK
eukprot:maker-scaffold506_size152672-snap-gene-0.28 protein:Tk07583 transcript:maker-scaffold506_size152672-snap-gene-0.28-mRNA-1 annotation:"hypothetical protein DAPPUDRAFT_305834"